MSVKRPEGAGGEDMKSALTGESPVIKNERAKSLEKIKVYKNPYAVMLCLFILCPPRLPGDTRKGLQCPQDNRSTADSTWGGEEMTSWVARNRSRGQRRPWAVLRYSKGSPRTAFALSTALSLWDSLRCLWPSALQTAFLFLCCYQRVKSLLKEILIISPLWLWTFCYWILASSLC